MIHTRTKIIAFIALGFFSAMLVVYVLFFRMVNEHKANLDAERARAASAEAQRKGLSTLEAAVATTEKSRDRLTQFVLKEEDIIEFLSRMEQTARSQGVVITTESLTVEPVNDIFESLLVSLKLEGSFDGNVRMLRILEALPQQSALSRVTLTKVSRENGEWQTTFDLRVTKFKKHEN